MTENLANGKIYLNNSVGMKLYGENVSGTDPELVGISTRAEGNTQRVYITPEDFVRIVKETDIPGVTISYTAPLPPLPTEDGLYAPKVKVEAGDLAYARILRLTSGQWRERDDRLDEQRVRRLQAQWGGLVRLVPEVNQ